MYKVAFGRVYLQVFPFTLITRSVPSIFPSVIWEMVRHGSTELFESGKAISITYSERLSVALVMQHAKRMRRILSNSAASTFFFFFQNHKKHDFE